tara:strand:+ start:700 stop:1173 length:474 start_codon:yes stop_codon:yes gene_type:complete
MGYSESQVAQNYKGLCITCYVKERVESKIMTGKEPVIPSTQKSIETVFNKFEEILVTTEVSTNLNIKSRIGIVSAEFCFTNQKLTWIAWLVNILLRRKAKKQDALSQSLELAILDLKSKAIQQEANCIVGLTIDLVPLGMRRNDDILVSVVGTAVKI